MQKNLLKFNWMEVSDNLDLVPRQHISYFLFPMKGRSDLTWNQV